MKKVRNSYKSEKHFGYGPVVVLMGACICVVVALVLALVVTDGSDKENKNIDSSVSDVVIDDFVSKSEEQTADTEETLQESNKEEMIVAESLLIEAIESDIPPSEPAEPETYEFTVSDKSYFDDALFIGDSRTAGLQKYGTLDNADFFASAGLNLYTIDSTKVEVEEGKKIKLEEMLTQNTYGKVYVMLGINELGYDFDTTVEKYRAFIEYIFTMQPDAILYVCANMHVNSLRSELDEIHNNPAINKINEQIASFADQKNIFYLDVNPLFDDENGNLAQEYISDDTHLMGMYYETWCEWYCQNTIVKQN